MRKIAYFMITAALVFTSAASANQTLAMQSGCLGCHKADAKLVGPAFRDIAIKYAGEAGASERLAKKVKAGSQPGEVLVWGGVTMPPSAASEEKIKEVIDWVMTLK